MLPSSFSDLLTKQLLFILEIDKLKTILRKNNIVTTSRRENSAEHSWHLILAAMILEEYSNEKIDLLHTLKMLAIHDLVEIEAGDTFHYDKANDDTLFEREREGAEKVFALLPAEQGKMLLELWLEFAHALTPEAKFANSIDRFLPMLFNFYSQGKMWKEFSITADMVLEKNQQIEKGSEQLWYGAEHLMKEAVERNYLAK